MGTVRAILWQHLWELGRRTGIPPVADDPNQLIPADSFQEALDHHGDDVARHAAGIAYAKLWARTFPTLVRQARGEPERMLSLFADEVLPFLTGRRVAAVTSRLARHKFRMLADVDLDPAYTTGLLQGFVSLTGATVEVTAQRTGDYLITARTTSRDRTIRVIRHVAQLRLPLLLTSALAAAVGIALANATGNPTILTIVAVLTGTVAAQSGANAAHDLRHPRMVKLRPISPSRGWLWFQAAGSFTLAAAALALLTMDTPATILFAAIGLATASLYGRGRDAGLGPLMAGLTHGPLIVWGAAIAAGGTGLLAMPLTALALAAPTGLLAAAILQLDDIADRPLHEAAGRRTLVVRNTPARSLRMLDALLLSGTAIAAGFALLAGLLLGSIGVILLFLGAALATQIHREAGNPERLAHSRILLSGLYATTTLLLTLSFL